MTDCLSSPNKLGTRVYLSLSTWLLLSGTFFLIPSADNPLTLLNCSSFHLLFNFMHRFAQRVQSLYDQNQVQQRAISEISGLGI